METAQIIYSAVLGLIAIAILYKQYRLEHMQWRLALYEKRYEVFDKTMKFISLIVRDGKISNEALMEFLRDTKHKEFLFGKEIHKFLDRIYKNGLNLRANVEVLESRPVEEERQKTIKNKTELIIWFGKQFQQSTELFGAYLTMDKK